MSNVVQFRGKTFLYDWTVSLHPTKNFNPNFKRTQVPRAHSQNVFPQSQKITGFFRELFFLSFSLISQLLSGTKFLKKRGPSSHVDQWTFNLDKIQLHKTVSQVFDPPRNVWRPTGQVPNKKQILISVSRKNSYVQNKSPQFIPQLHFVETENTENIDFNNSFNSIQ